ncbi:c-type cytochrome biogenesis protein CcmI, partial [Acinetobacter baumannii]
VLLPLASFAVYGALGAPAALSPVKSASELTRADVEVMVASLEQKLRQNPDDQKGWAMLARSLRVFGRHKDAADAFARA